jgi:hypothetical protein
MKMILGLLPAISSAEICSPVFGFCLPVQAGNMVISKTRQVVDRVLITGVNYFLKNSIF